MSKRFTESDKWRNVWFRKLPLRYKCFWLYLLDSCDSVGTWRIDFETASFQIGEPIDETVLDHLSHRVYIYDGGEKLWVADFIHFQHGDIRKTRSPILKRVAAKLKENELWSEYLKQFPAELPLCEKKQQVPRRVQEEVKEEVEVKEEREDMGKHAKEIRYIIDAWCAAHPGKRRPNKTEGVNGACAKIAARLSAGRTVNEIIKAIKGNASDEWHRGKNKHELSYVCQSCDRLDQMISKHTASDSGIERWRFEFNQTISNYADLWPQLEKLYGPRAEVKDKTEAAKWIATARELSS